jgi:hypothetical protein
MNTFSLLHNWVEIKNVTALIHPSCRAGPVRYTGLVKACSENNVTIDMRKCAVRLDG